MTNGNSKEESMASYYDPTSKQKKSMNDLLFSLDYALHALKKTEGKALDLSDTIQLLQCIHEMSTDSNLDAISDLAYQVSTYLMEITRVNIPYDQRIVAHLFVTRSLIREAYEKLLKGGMPYNSTRASALIGSFHRCIRDMAQEHGRPKPFKGMPPYMNA